MRHAYLIMAHNNFKVLEQLIKALDDSRNDIYVHIDRRAAIPSGLKCENGRLFVLNNRIKVIWGDVAQIKAEYLLYEAAFANGPYDFYHLISGVHFPLKSQDELNSFFENHEGECILMKNEVNEEEVNMRLGRYHFFMKHLIDRRKWVNKLYHLGWRFILFLQRGFKFRDTSFVHGKASQWCSLTEEAVKALIDNKEASLKRFSRSFCSDEFFVLSVIGTMPLPIIDNRDLTYIEFKNTTPRVFTMDDYDTLMNSNALFARKFGDSNLDLVCRIAEKIS